MGKMKNILLLLVLASLLSACGDSKEAKACVTMYDVATDKVLKANSPEELLEVSYALHLELVELAADGEIADVKNVTRARQRFETAIKEKYIEFYTVIQEKK